MGLVDRQYMHPDGCACSECENDRQKYAQIKIIDGLLAAEKYRKDKESEKALRRLLQKDVVCKHSRPLSAGEKREDTFCTLLGVPCYIVRGESCSSKEELTPDIKCPICGSATSIRTLKKNRPKFHVCINYPQCKGKIRVNKREL